MTGTDVWPGRKRFVDAGGARIAYVECDGAGPPLILLHGFTDSSRSFSLIAPELAGRRLIIADLPGHGGSTPGDDDWTPADLARQMLAFITCLEMEPAVLVGHSLGSMVAIELAANNPRRFTGLVLLAATLRPDLADDHPVATGVDALRDPIDPNAPFFELWHHCHPGVPRTFLARLAKEAAAMPAHRWRAILQALRGCDLSGQASRIDMPVLIIGGADDDLFGQPHHEALVAAFPDAEALRLDDCGHNPHWDAPKRVAAAITRAFPAMAQNTGRDGRNP